jgi:hypothetical protein
MEVLIGMRRILESCESIRIVVEILNNAYFSDIAEFLGKYKIMYVRKVSGTNFIFESLK